LSTRELLRTNPAAARRFSIFLVFVCTVLGAAAQILMKMGTQAAEKDGALQLLIAIFHTPTLFAGYALYGLSTLVLVVALKYGELSILYPVIALTYVWVTALSVFFYGESLNPLKLMGLATVVFGVALLGKATRR
jgi:multidrug transporter EmrE-like cation transporter